MGNGIDPQTEIYGIKPLPTNKQERYLGIMLGHKPDFELNWSKVIDKLSANPAHWSTMNISIFGRVLLLNSCLLSKLWFIAHHIPVTKKIMKEINKHVDGYFRRGMKSNSVNRNKRLTPKHLGGLCQLNPAD